MTYDKIIAKMDDFNIGLSNGFGDVKTLVQFVNALRAVVELHKPDEPDFPDEWESCVECSGNGYSAMYPCNTIQAIEKELS
jgi:hypothetical protein